MPPHRRGLPGRRGRGPRATSSKSSSKTAARRCRRRPMAEPEPARRRRQGHRPDHGPQGRDRLPLAQAHRRAERTLRRQVRLHHQPPELRAARRRSRQAARAAGRDRQAAGAQGARSSGWTTSSRAWAPPTARWPFPRPAACTTCSKASSRRRSTTPFATRRSSTSPAARTRARRTTSPTSGCAACGSARAPGLGRGLPGAGSAAPQERFGQVLGEFKIEDCPRVVEAVLDTFLRCRQGDETLSDAVWSEGARAIPRSPA